MREFANKKEKWQLDIEARSFLNMCSERNQEEKQTAELCRILEKKYRDQKISRIIVSSLKVFFYPLYAEFERLAGIIRAINNSIFGMDGCEKAIVTMEKFVQQVPADENIMTYPKASSNEVVQAKEFLKRERNFQRDLYAILGYFVVELKCFPQLLENLNKAFTYYGHYNVEILGQHGYLQQMLNTSRRFTDQLDDMFDGDDGDMDGKEDQNGSIAEIFHDVAKGQVLDTFIEYVKQILGRETNGPSPSVSEVYDIIHRKIEAKVKECSSDIINRLDEDGKTKFYEIRDQVIWLLPELLLRPIYRAFCTIENLNSIKEAINAEIEECYGEPLRENYLRNEERVLDQVLEEGNKLKNGLTQLLSRDWLTAFKRHDKHFFPSIWYREIDDKLFLDDSVKEFRRLIEERTSPDKVSYWGGKTSGAFWDDAERLILDEPIEKYINGKKNHLMKGITKKVKHTLDILGNKKDKRRIALVKRTFSVGFLIYSKTEGALFKIDEWQGPRHHANHVSDTILERLEDETSNKTKITLVYQNKVISQSSETICLVFNERDAERRRLMVGLLRARKHRAINEKISALLKTQIDAEAPQPHRNEILRAAPDSPFGEKYTVSSPNRNLISLLEIIENYLTSPPSNQILKKNPKSQNPHESAEDHYTRIFLFVYKKLKDGNDEDLSPDKLFHLLKLRFNLPTVIEENEDFRTKLDNGLVCFGEFLRSYQNKLLQPCSSESHSSPDSVGKRRPMGRYALPSRRRKSSCAKDSRLDDSAYGQIYCKSAICFQNIKKDHRSKL